MVSYLHTKCQKLLPEPINQVQLQSVVFEDLLDYGLYELNSLPYPSSVSDGDIQPCSSPPHPMLHDRGAMKLHGT